MHRILIALLAAIDALLAAAIGLAVVLAPLTLLWTFSFGGGAADWGALWSTTARLWQLAQFVPLHIGLDADALAALGIPTEGASFWVSLAPLALAVFVVLFAARSGRRAVRSGAWMTGVVAGTVTTAVVAVLVLTTSDNGIAQASSWQAVLFPIALYAAGLAAGVVLEGWSEGDGGLIDRLHGWVDEWPSAWREIPTIAVRGAAVALLGVVGAASVGVVVAAIAQADDVIALYQRSQVDLVGVIAVSLAQLAYLPTLIGWTVSWLAGPGFVVGTGAAVSPAGTDLGVVPGIPVLGLVPDGSSGWLLLVCLIPVAAGVLAGWTSRAVLAAEWAADPPVTVEYENEPAHEPALPRLVLAVGIAVLAALGAALLAVLCSGAMGPGRLIEVGPEPGPVALAIGLEVFVGAAVVLLGPRSRRAD